MNAESSAGNQLSLFDVPAKERGPRRRLPRKRAARAPAPDGAPTMFEDRRCGFCGAQTTIAGNASVCEGCGAVMLRER
jgi:ribosomal protein S27E